MKRLLYIIWCSVVCFSAYAQPAPSLDVTITNPSRFDRLTELVELPLATIQAKITLQEGQAYEVVNSHHEVIPSQVTSNHKFLFPAEVKAGETVTYTIEAAKAQKFEAKTYGRFIQERKEDFAWENDRVAFRIYGQALIPIDGPSNGLDIWYKRTSDLIINKWYEKDLAGIAPYHHDNGEGLDDFKVGRTLGAGAMAPYLKDSLWLNENYLSHEVLDNGPLRTTFRLTYKDIIVDGQSYAESRTFSIDAGSQLTKVIQEYGFTEPAKVAAGIVTRDVCEGSYEDPARHYIVYNEPRTKLAEGVYIGLVFPETFDEVISDQGHLLVTTVYQPHRPVTYYTGYGWNKFGFADAAAFQTYLDHFSQAIQTPLIISINN